MKPIYWAGSSLEDLRGFPLEARQEAGFQLDRVQRGLEPNDWKPMAGVPGVREIRIRIKPGAFRILYVASIAEQTVVLHAFQKKTRKTSKSDIDLAKARLKAARSELT